MDDRNGEPSRAVRTGSIRHCSDSSISGVSLTTAEVADMSAEQELDLSSTARPPLSHRLPEREPRRGQGAQCSDFVRTESLRVVDCVVPPSAVHQGEQRGLRCSRVQAPRKRSMCFSRALYSASTVPAVKEPFAREREETRSFRSRSGAGSGGLRLGFAYLNSHGAGLPPEPRDLQARLTRRPRDEVSLHARASCKGQIARGSANRRAITAVLGATNKTLFQCRRLLSCR